MWCTHIIIDASSYGKQNYVIYVMKKVLLNKQIYIYDSRE